MQDDWGFRVPVRMPKRKENFLEFDELWHHFRVED